LCKPSQRTSDNSDGLRRPGSRTPPFSPGIFSTVKEHLSFCFYIQGGEPDAITAIFKGLLAFPSKKLTFRYLNIDWGKALQVAKGDSEVFYLMKP